MPIVKAEKATYEPTPKGVHQAIFQEIISLGTHQPMDPTHRPSFRIFISWELVHETYQDKDGATKRRRIGQEYGLSLGKKSNLRKMLDEARGVAFTDAELQDGFDLSKLLGVNCQVNVIHRKKASDPTQLSAKIAGVIPLGKGMTPATLERPAFLWDLPESGPISVPTTIPEWLARKIQESDEWKARHGSKLAASEGLGAKATDSPKGDEDVPF